MEVVEVVVIIALEIIKWLFEHWMETAVIIAIAINTYLHYCRIQNEIIHQKRLEELLADISNKLRPLTDINNKLRKLQKKIPSHFPYGTNKKSTDTYWKARKKEEAAAQMSDNK